MSPDRIHEWVRLIQSENPQEQSAAIDALTPIIRRQARRLRAGSGSWDADDLVEEAPSIIWQLIQRGKYTREENFHGWCSKVLWREYLTRIEKSNTRKRKETRFPTSVQEDAPAIARAIAARARFSLKDLEILQSWPVKPRLLILAIAGLWRKVDQAIWLQWVEEAGFLTPFPPEGFVDALDRTQRLEDLADAARSTRNSISNVKRRYLHQLRRLPYIQEL